MPVYRNPPADDFHQLTHAELKETVFLPNLLNVSVVSTTGARAEAALLGWRGYNREHVFLSHEALPCRLPNWTVDTVHFGSHGACR